MPVSADKWPWPWTYALFLDKRWEQIQEVGSMYGDEDMPEGNNLREVPREFWHDKTRVDEWIREAKERRKKKNES